MHVASKVGNLCCSVFVLCGGSETFLTRVFLVVSLPVGVHVDECVCVCVCWC